MMRTLSLFPAVSRCGSFEQTEVQDYFMPTSRVDESAESYSIELDVPGFKKEEIKIETDHRLLSISGERKNKYRIQKRFNLPDDVELDAITAKHEDGILYLVLPKVAHAKSREIKISP
jgi:HSP20 family protein